ncbi:uncharacterized protein LOC129582348 [Paramacrobiotus metropolitanus]|uniref:uncharacterized protein LOC129582348 n=1 Tax=Paramacrobiotus metropolitanus TaxID=2943436 RepID=UPI0024458E97|nr:uncharacterized protein LOC129582348 [Paramacrobiotus metropolitanus]
MHFYEIFRRTVSAWNAVDVLVDENGPLQHGSVINIVEDGVIVDFYCESQRSVLVAFGKTFLASSREKELSWSSVHFPEEWPCMDRRPPAGVAPPDVQVLLRVCPTGPWAWHPGKLLMHQFECADEYAFVEVQLGAVKVRELVNTVQVRFPLSVQEMQYWMLKPGDFVVRSIPLPAGYWQCITPSLSAAFSQETEEQLGARCICVHSERMVYLRSCGRTAISDSSLASHLEKAKTYANNARYVSCGREYHYYWGSPKSTLSGPLKTKRVKVSAAGIPIPRLLLVEIFQSLDTIERLRCRRMLRVGSHFDISCSG